MDTSMLQKAVDMARGEFTLEDIIKFVEEGKMQLIDFPNASAQAVTEVVQYARKKRLRVILLAGEFNNSIIDFIESFAKALGLDGVELTGRKGWVRKLKPYGYEETSVNVLKEFGD